MWPRAQNPVFGECAAHLEHAKCLEASSQRVVHARIRCFLVYIDCGTMRSATATCTLVFISSAVRRAYSPTICCMPQLGISARMRGSEDSSAAASEPVVASTDRVPQGVSSSETIYKNRLVFGLKRCPVESLLRSGEHSQCLRRG